MPKHTNTHIQGAAGGNLVELAQNLIAGLEMHMADSGNDVIASLRSEKASLESENSRLLKELEDAKKEAHQA